MSKKKRVVGLLVMLLLVTSLSAFAVSKTITLTLNYKPQTPINPFDIVELKVQDGSYNSKFKDIGEYKVSLISDKGTVIDSLRFNTPQGVFSIVLPYHENTRFIYIYNKFNNKILEIPFISEKNADDKLNAESNNLESSNFFSASTPIDYLIYTLPLIAILIMLYFIERHRKKGHTAISVEHKQHILTGLRQYILKNLNAGYSRQQIVAALMKANYPIRDIEIAFSGLNSK